ncbi:MAG: hypothetical protein ACO1RT_09145 [Planctomycetaceae bacterium]
MDRHSTEHEPIAPTDAGPQQVESAVAILSFAGTPAANPASASPLASGTPTTTAAHWSASTSSLERRELQLARREADLQARRREAAREIRRSRRESSAIEDRLAGLESMLTKLAQVVVERSEPSLAMTTHGEERSNPQLEDELRREIDTLRDAIETLTIQNEHLAGEIAQSSVRKSINGSSDACATMTWEQRKAMMFAQDQDPLADADSSLGTNTAQQDAVERLRKELQSRDAEIAQLRELLERRPMQAEEGTAVGAAAIVQMMDSDELICEERQRLQELQGEWETKFRQMEIAASIERASLARERQQLERQNAELEEQLAHLKRELRQEEMTGPNQSRRWLAKLGLAE